MLSEWLSPIVDIIIKWNRIENIYKNNLSFLDLFNENKFINLSIKKILNIIKKKITIVKVVNEFENINE